MNYNGKEILRVENIFLCSRNAKKKKEITFQTKASQKFTSTLFLLISLIALNVSV